MANNLIAGVIGVGAMGRNHVRVYSELKNIDAVSVYDTDERSLINAIVNYGADGENSIKQLVDNVDLVSICVPTRYHYKVLLEVIEHAGADVPILIEKPIFSSYKEIINFNKLDDIWDFPLVGVGHIERFNPIVFEIGKIIKDPLYIKFERHNPLSTRITDSTVIEDLMIHDIDILFHVLGYKYLNPDRVFGCGNEHLFSVLIENEKKNIYLSASRKSSKKIRKIYIEEEDYTIEGNFMNQEIYIHKKPEKYNLKNDRYNQENIVEKVLVNKTEPLKTELQLFVDAARTGKPFPVTIEQAITNLEFCEYLKNKTGVILWD